MAGKLPGPIGVHEPVVYADGSRLTTFLPGPLGLDRHDFPGQALYALEQSLPSMIRRVYAPASTAVLTPTQFKDRYRSMSVAIDDGKHFQVDVHQYLINRDSSAHNAKAARAMYAKISKKMDEEVHASKAKPKLTRVKLIADLDSGLSDSLLAAVAFGKGSPTAIAAYLRLAVRYGFAKAERIQSFADDRNVGLDCSGFVSNYLVALGKMKPAAVMDTNAASYDVAARRRKTLDSVRALDIMVWSHHDHVAVIDSEPVPHQVPNPAKRSRPHARRGTHKEYRCTLVESNGGRGLDAEEYRLVAVNSHDVFTVRRHDGQTHHVYIVDRGLGT